MNHIWFGGKVRQMRRHLISLINVFWAHYRSSTACCRSPGQCPGTLTENLLEQADATAKAILEIPVAGVKDALETDDAVVTVRAEGVGHWPELIGELAGSVRDAGLDFRPVSEAPPSECVIRAPQEESDR